MDLVVYAHGRQWIPAFGSMPYETKLKYDWTAQTISNNTMVVDGISQKPTGTRHTEWPQDSNTDRVCGVLDHFDAQAKSVSAHCDNAYEGILLRRAVGLQEHTVVDTFSAADANGAEHQYDYMLHLDGQFESSSAPLEERAGKLGERCGYELVEQKRRGTAAGAFTLTFSRDGQQLRVWAPDGGSTDVIVAEGLTNSPERKMTMLVLRRQAARTRFLIVLEPVKAESPLRSVRLEGGELVMEFAGGARRVRVEPA
jgi:hypothetical protein